MYLLRQQLLHSIDAYRFNLRALGLSTEPVHRYGGAEAEDQSSVKRMIRP
jgi:hypothetical protein